MPSVGDALALGCGGGDATGSQLGSTSAGCVGSGGGDVGTGGDVDGGRDALADTDDGGVASNGDRSGVKCKVAFASTVDGAPPGQPKTTETITITTPAATTDDTVLAQLVPLSVLMSRSQGRRTESRVRIIAKKPQVEH